MPEPNFEIWVKLLGPPRSIQKALRELLDLKQRLTNGTRHPNPRSVYTRLAWPTNPSMTSYKPGFLKPGPTFLVGIIDYAFMDELSNSPFSQLHPWTLQITLTFLQL